MHVYYVCIKLRKQTKQTSRTISLSCTTTQQHNSTTAQQHNNTTTQQHNDTTTTTTTMTTQQHIDVHSWKFVVLSNGHNMFFDKVGRPISTPAMSSQQASLWADAVDTSEDENQQVVNHACQTGPADKTVRARPGSPQLSEPYCPPNAVQNPMLESRTKSVF